MLKIEDGEGDGDESSTAALLIDRNDMSIGRHIRRREDRAHYFSGVSRGLYVDMIKI